MYWIREFKNEDFVLVYQESLLWNGWKIIYRTYGIKDFNKHKKHEFLNR